VIANANPLFTKPHIYVLSAKLANVKLYRLKNKFGKARKFNPVCCFELSFSHPNIKGGKLLYWWCNYVFWLCLDATRFYYPLYYSTVTMPLYTILWRSMNHTFSLLKCMKDHIHFDRKQRGSCSSWLFCIKTANVNCSWWLTRWEIIYVPQR
jgi:hypothetical protein